MRAIPVAEAVGMALGHDVTEVRPGAFKGRAFARGHVVREEDLPRLLDCGKCEVFVLEPRAHELHEDEAAEALARALCGEGVEPSGPPREGRVDLVAARDGLLGVDEPALRAFNLLGDVACATLHGGTLVRRGRVVAGTRAIPLVIARAAVDAAVRAAGAAPGGVLAVRPLRRPRVGLVVTGTEVASGRVRDAFGPLIAAKAAEFGGAVVASHVVRDDAVLIEAALRAALAAGADLLVATGGMSVDPGDRTRAAVGRLGVRQLAYGSAALPGSMLLVAYVDGPRGEVPLLGVPACALSSPRTVLDLVLPRVLAGERVGRRELAEFGHGGLCLRCEVCRYPVCPFGK